MFCFLELNLIHIIGSDKHNAITLAPRLKEEVKRIETLKGKKGGEGIGLGQS